MSVREQILSQISSVPSLPVATVRMMHCVHDPDADLNEITRLIEFDPGMTTNVLRMANSPLFGCARSISSIHEALLRLGTSNTFRLVLTSSVTPIAWQQVKGYDLQAGKLWEHLVAVAVCSGQLASTLGIDSLPSLFTAALLHDIGKVILGMSVEEKLGSIIGQLDNDRMTFEEAERNVLGIDHAEVGAILLDNWHLPEEIIMAARYHHHPEACSCEPLIIDLVHIADMICMTGGIGSGTDGLQYRPCEQSLQRLRLTSSIIENVTCKTLIEIDKVRELFNYDAGRS